MKKINCLFIALIVAGISYLATYQYYKKEIQFAENNAELLETYDILKENFYLDVDDDELTYNMIGGLINDLNDTYTYYRNSRVSNENDVNTSITLKSSGFQIAKDKTGNILVSEVKPNSQAEKMGLQVNDLIIEIDGQNVIETGYYNIIRELLGKDYTSMHLKIMRQAEIFDIDFIRRNIIKDYSPYHYELIEDDTLYFRFNLFDENLIPNFQKAMTEYEFSNIIFDLRQNTGGITEITVKFFDMFAKEGNSVREVFSRKDRVYEYITSTDGNELNYNVVLLVSENTTSSGEILPLLFQDNELGTVIGTQTKGKGVFQQVYQLDDYTSFGIVCGYYYVNDIPNYNNIGITPDIEMPMDISLIGTDDDIQLKKALEIF